MSQSQNKAQSSRTAIERLYIEMRHVFNSGAFRPKSISGKVIQEALLTLSPEIYGSINEPEKVELDGLVYVVDRLPKGIEQCHFIKLTSEEGHQSANFETIIPLKRRRNCYRLDEETMLIEVTRGRSEIYDILTHLTFLYHEAEKIRQNAFQQNSQGSREWKKLENIIQNNITLYPQKQEQAFSYLSSLLGRTFAETKDAYERLAENTESNNGLFQIVYFLGQVCQEESQKNKAREITFTPSLRERIGRHIYGEKWSQAINSKLSEHNLLHRPLHIISANLHSILNCLYAYESNPEKFQGMGLSQIAAFLGQSENERFNERIERLASQSGAIFLEDTSGTNINVQIFDLASLNIEVLHPDLRKYADEIIESKPVIIVMDYAFGEQAYETMDELLKPYEQNGQEIRLNVVSISIMGKAGILEGGKGDIMLPSAHVFEGTADNYPFDNDFSKTDFQGQGLKVCEGVMITVLGTSLQNRDVLAYFKSSSWKAIGLEMEGAHYQKAIQAQAKIRKNINENVKVRYAYYASDNPLVTGGTLASGSLGAIGIQPTYLITQKIVEKILQNPV